MLLCELGPWPRGVVVYIGELLIWYKHSRGRTGWWDTPRSKSRSSGRELISLLCNIKLYITATKSKKQCFAQQHPVIWSDLFHLAVIYHKKMLLLSPWHLSNPMQKHEADDLICSMMSLNQLVCAFVDRFLAIHTLWIHCKAFSPQRAATLRNDGSLRMYLNRRFEQ